MQPAEAPSRGAQKSIDAARSRPSCSGIARRTPSLRKGTGLNDEAHVFRGKFVAQGIAFPTVQPGVAPTTNALLLGYQYRPYTAHVGWVRLTYAW